MTNRRKLTDEEIREGLGSASGWELRGGKLHRELKFDDFAAAFGFMTAVALVAEKMDHHPEWSNVFNRVTVDLATHDARGITALDFELARAIDRLA